MMDLSLIIFISGVLILAAITDVMHQRIPNWLTFPTMIIAIMYHTMKSGHAGLFFSLGGLALGIGIFIIPYLMGGMGAGDAKLLGAVGAVVGPSGVFTAALLTAVFGGVYALGLLLLNYKHGKQLIINSATTLKTFIFTGQFICVPVTAKAEKLKLCYGVAIALGTCVYILLEATGNSFVFLF
jgi:prepilin peptidase CpaA